MTTEWQPYREPLRVTLLRTGTIAVVIALAITRGRALSLLPTAILLALWPTLGGHGVELWFLNWLRPSLSPARVVQGVARILVWFIGGIVLFLGMHLTAMALGGFQSTRWPAWWIGGIAFIGIE